MEKIDLKDRKILYELDIDSRQSFRNIGRKVGLSKDVVASRVKKLKETGIIIRFFTYYDILQLGVNFLRFYFKFQYVTPEIKEEIINHFMNDDYVNNLFSTEGSYDLGVLMMVENISDIYPLWKKTLQKYGDYFSKQVFSAYMGELIYGHAFLLDGIEKTDRTPLRKNWGKVKIDNLDLEILKLLVSDSRMPTIEIAKKLNSNVTTIHSRIKRLVDLKVILGFSVELDLNKIGYQVWKVDFYLSEYTKINQIIKYIEKNPLLYCVDYTIGYADLELEINVKNINQLHEIIEDLHSKFPKIIRNYSYFRVVEFYKWFNF
ncbi:MAG: Lrp/AsnC family transcriptional regulator [Thermoplasmatales archaeon]|nr:MAG: Lrp/AsnC family transcriptional regulator [Thermoplasmatales archaeon]